jgi:hypothetical protein
MGFKFKRIDLTAGSSEFPTGSSDALRRSRAETILSKCAQAILDCNCGWALDTSKNATVNSFVNIPCNNNALTFPGLFFVNSTSGCKLFVAYFAEKNQYGIKDFSGNGSDIFCLNNSTGRYSSCLCMSMIPDGSSSTFGDPATTTFLPADATRIIGTGNSSTDYNDYASYAYNPQAGYVASWGLFVSPYAIVVCTKRQSGSAPSFGVPSYAIGRIFGTLAHTEDNTGQAKYGVINFRQNSSGLDYEGSQDPIAFSSGAGGSPAKYFCGNDPNQSVAAISDLAIPTKACASVSKADGSWIGGTDSANFGSTFYPSDVGQLSPYIFNSSGNNKSRWVPYAVAVVSNDLTTYGVVPGDGFKGYLDTDLFRCALGTYGQTFDNGNFICADATYNFLIGWDSTNTDSIAG